MGKAKGDHDPHVYAMQFGKGNPIKIGWTVNIGRRLLEIQACHWLPVNMIAAVPGDRTQEAAIHRVLEKSRIESTEWFRPTEDVLTFCDEVASRDLSALLAASIAIVKRMHGLNVKIRKGRLAQPTNR